MSSLAVSLPAPHTNKHWLTSLITLACGAAVYLMAGGTVALIAVLTLMLYLRTNSLAIPVGVCGYLTGLVVALKLNAYLPSYDALLWRIDGCLGFQPSAWAMGILEYSPVLNFIASAVYEALPIALLITALVDKRPAELLRKAGLAGLMGFLLYTVCPAAGPLWYLTGQTEAAPKNALPSLHLTWALIVRKALGGRGLAVRSCGDAFVIFTVLSTCGTGEHFVVDLIAAVPFFLLIEYLCSAPVAKPVEAQPDYGARLMEVCTNG